MYVETNASILLLTSYVTVLLQIRLNIFQLCMVCKQATWLFSLGFCMKQHTCCTIQSILTVRVWYKVKVCEPAVLAVSFDKSRWSSFIFVFLWWCSVFDQCNIDLSSDIGVTDVPTYVQFLRYLLPVSYSASVYCFFVIFFSTIVFRLWVISRLCFNFRLVFIFCKHSLCVSLRWYFFWTE